MLFRLYAPKSEVGKVRVTPHSNPPPQGGRERCGAGWREQISRKPYEPFGVSAFDRMPLIAGGRFGFRERA